MDTVAGSNGGQGFSPLHVGFAEAPGGLDAGLDGRLDVIWYGSP